MYVLIKAHVNLNKLNQCITDYDSLGDFLYVYVNGPLMEIYKGIV